MNDIVRSSSQNSTWIRLAGSLVVFVILSGTFARVVGRTSGFAFTSATAATQQVVIAVEGMNCGKCAAGIKAMLKRTAGVVAAEVSYEKKEAAVDYDPDKTTPEKIAEAISNLGYKTKVKNKS